MQSCFSQASFYHVTNNNSIILRLGGDKGGHFIKFKFDVTVMNTPVLNFQDNADVLGTLDSKDSPFNLRHGLFNQWVEP